MSKKSDKGVAPLSIAVGLPLYIVWAAKAFGGSAEPDDQQNQTALRGLLGLTLLTHAGEAALISWRVRRRGYPEQSRAWALSTVLWGLFNLRRLRKLTPVT